MEAVVEGAPTCLDLSINRDAGRKPPLHTPYNLFFVNKNLRSGLYLLQLIKPDRSRRPQGTLVHIPARYYKRIPKFYFIVGILLVLTSFTMNGDKLAAYLYFMSGVVSVIYAVSVHQVRARGRRKQQLQDSQQPQPDSNAPPADNEQPHPDNSATPADNQQPRPDKRKSPSGVKNCDLPQHGGGIPSAGQPAIKP